MKHEEENIEFKDWNKKNPFMVPEGYFDQFPSRIMSRIEQIESSPQKKVGWLRFLGPSLGIAASVALVALMFYVPVKLAGPKVTQQAAENQYNPYDLESELFNDLTFFDLLTGQTEKEPMDNNTIETVLMASSNDYELMGY